MAFFDPAVAQAIEKQRPRQAMLQAAGGVGAFIFQIQVDARKSGQRQTDQVRVGGALIVSVDFANGMFNPGAIHRDFLFVILCLA